MFIQLSFMYQKWLNQPVHLCYSIRSYTVSYIRVFPGAQILRHWRNFLPNDSENKRMRVHVDATFSHSVLTVISVEHLQFCCLVSFIIVRSSLKWWTFVTFFNAFKYHGILQELIILWLWYTIHVCRCTPKFWKWPLKSKSCGSNGPPILRVKGKPCM